MVCSKSCYRSVAGAIFVVWLVSATLGQYGDIKSGVKLNTNSIISVCVF